MRIGIQTWGSHGDIIPFVALAGGLSRAGHDVGLVVTSIEGRDYRHFGEDMDFRVEQSANLFQDRAEFARLAHEIGYEKNPLRQMGIVMQKMFEPQAAEMYSQAEGLSRESDAMIGHFVHYPAQAAAEKAGLPYITVTLNHMGIPTGHTPPSKMPDIGRMMNSLQWKFVMKVMSSHFAPTINRFRGHRGCPPVKSVREVWESRVLNLIAVSRIFCRGYPDWDDNQRVCGFLGMPETPVEMDIPAGLDEFISSGPPPAYINFGSMVTGKHGAGYINATTRLMVDAARLSGTRAIIQSHWDDVSGIDGSDDVFKVGGAPHMAIFPRCSLVVHHGGAGTTHSSTRAGCPSVVVAYMADQHFWGSELRRLGIAPGPLSRPSVTPEKLADHIRLVLRDPGMKARAEELGRELRDEDGVGRAVELIERHLGIRKAISQ